MRVFVALIVVTCVVAMPNNIKKKHQEGLESMVRELMTNVENQPEQTQKKGEEYNVAYLENIAGINNKKKAEKKGGSPPNVFFFLIDDLGWNDVSWHNPDVQMPVLDALRRDSLALENAYAQAVCSPSRGALMTGKYPFHTGMQHDVIQWTSPECAPLKYTFLPEKLQSAGYGTYMLGKWHLGFCAWECTPTYRGFDEFFGFYQGYIDHYHHFTGAPGLEGYDWRDGEEAVTAHNGTYATDLLTERAIEMINNHDQSKPMFMYFSHAATHTPLQAPQKFLDMYDDSLDDAHHRKAFLAMATALDDSIGQTIDAIKAAGMYDNSVIIFQSDNGGEFFAGSNAPLRGSKTSVYEAGTRVPVFFHSPLSSVSGISNDLFHITDWHPTILSMAGVTVDSDLDGIDQSNLLLNGGDGLRDEMVYNIDQVFPQLFGVGALRQGKYKLIQGYPGLFDGYESEGTLGMTHELKMVKKSDGVSKKGNYVFDMPAIMDYIKEVADAVQLFDLEADPNETTNIAADNPDVVADMQARLAELTAEAVMPDLSIQAPAPAGEVANWDGIWTPGWCDPATLG